MAYQKENTVNYFPHKVIHGRKMFIVRNKFKNDGYAVWFMLLEELGKANNHFINLKDKTQLLYLSGKMDVSEELFLEIINLLVDLNEFDSELWSEAQVIYSQKFVDSIKDAYKRRKNDLLTYSQICMQFLKKCKQNSKIDNTIQQTKRNDIKRNEIFKDNDFNAFEFLKENAPSQIEAFEMQNKKSFADWPNFILNFNSKVIEEKLEFDVSILWARLQRLNGNWTKEKQTYIPDGDLKNKLSKHG